MTVVEIVHLIIVLLIIVLPQEKSLSVSLDQQCGPDTGPS